MPVRRGGFLAPADSLFGDPPRSRHSRGTLRMGEEPSRSVVGPQGRFYGVDDLAACDGSAFFTARGYDPTLTRIAVGLRIASEIVGASQR